MRRRHYLDWLRGVAVLLMIAGHLFDSWTREPDRLSGLYHTLLTVVGIGSSFFLLLAGVSVSLSAASKARRWDSDALAASAVMVRGWQIFALAFAFRLQAWLLGGSGDATDLLRVDMLNIMGPSIVLAAALWRIGGTAGQRVVVFAAVTAAIAFVTPVTRTLSLEGIPASLRAYVIPVSGLSNFVVFPWTAMVTAGALIGVLLDRTDDVSSERNLNRRLCAAGVGLAAAAYAASFLPAPWPGSFFWTSSPSYFFLRVGLVVAAIGGAFAWTSRSGAAGETWSPILQLGRTSLFIYWIHVEMVYGLVSRPIHRQLTLAESAVAFVLFSAFMLLCSVARVRVAAWYAPRPAA